MPTINIPVLITAGDLEGTQSPPIGGTSFHLFGEQPGQITLTVPIPAEIPTEIQPPTVPPTFEPVANSHLITGVSWTPLAGMRNMSRAFRWIRTRRATFGRNKILLSAQSFGIPGRVAILVQVEIERYSTFQEKDLEDATTTPPFTATSVNAANYGYRILRNLNLQNGLIELPHADDGHLGLDFFVFSRAVDPGPPSFLAIKTEDPNDELLMQQNSTSNRMSSFKFVRTREADEYLVVTCKNSNRWVIENRTDNWVGVEQ